MGVGTVFLVIDKFICAIITITIMQKFIRGEAYDRMLDIVPDKRTLDGLGLTRAEYVNDFIDEAIITACERREAELEHERIA